MREQQKLIILFDGQCMLCNRFIRVPLNYSKKKFIFISSHSNIGEKICISFDIPTNPRKETIYLINKEKLEYKTKSEAIIEILKRCSLQFKLLAYFILIFPKFIRNPIYDLISSNRKINDKYCKIIPNNAEQEIFM